MYKLFSLLTLLLVKTSIAQENGTINRDGIYTGINVGTWLPLSKNKVLGTPSILGFSADFKIGKTALGLSFDLIGLPYGKTQSPITIKYGDTSIIRNDYFGVNIRLDYYRELYKAKHIIFEGLCGVGYGALTYYNPSNDIQVQKSSFILSPGLSLRYFFKSKTYLQIKAQYCVADYKLKDKVSTDFSGHFIILKLCLGTLTNNP